MTLVVSADVADHVHVHGYDLMADVTPGSPARISFKATVPGRFEVELSRRRSGAEEGNHADLFLGSLIPIAAAYGVSHYFSSLLVQGQFAITLASDPLGRGWDLFGTADFQPNIAPLSPNTIWYVQVAALVGGHVLGLVLAHDRALTVAASPERAVRAQLPLLALMVLYTVSGLWLLSQN